MWVKLEGQKLLLPVPADQQTGPPDHQGATENAAIVAGVAAALLLLVALTLLAVYYINTHPTVAPPFYLMQVRRCRPWSLLWPRPRALTLTPPPTCVLPAAAAQQQLLALHEVPQPGLRLQLHRGGAGGPGEGRLHRGRAVLLRSGEGRRHLEDTQQAAQSTSSATRRLDTVSCRSFPT